MGKTRDLFKKTGDIKILFYARMDAIKDRNGKDLREAEELKKGWQECTTELHKKGLNDLGKHNVVVMHLEPDILGHEVKWALGSVTVNKARGGDRIPAELSQILKDDAVKMLHSISQQIWKTVMATGLEKENFHSNPKEEQFQRTTVQFHSFHMLGR